MTLSRRVPLLTLAAFAVAVSLGGANFVAVRVSNQELAPVWGASLRFGLAAALFVVIVFFLRLHWPRGRLLALTAVYGAFAFAIPYALLYWALTQATAGSATVVMAGVPLVTLFLAVTQRLENFRIRALAGAVLALAGIMWRVTGSEGLSASVGAVLAMLGAALAISQSIILGKQLSANHPAMTNAVAMTVATLLLGVLSASMSEPWALPAQPHVVVAVVYLVTLGSVGMFVLVLLVVRSWTSSANSYMFVLFPFVTLGLLPGSLMNR